VRFDHTQPTIFAPIVIFIILMFLYIKLGIIHKLVSTDDTKKKLMIQINLKDNNNYIVIL